MRIAMIVAALFTGACDGATGYVSTTDPIGSGTALSPPAWHDRFDWHEFERRRFTATNRKQVWDGSRPVCWEWDAEAPQFFWATGSSRCQSRFGAWRSAWAGDEFLGYVGDRPSPREGERRSEAPAKDGASP